MRIQDEMTKVDPLGLRQVQTGLEYFSEKIEEEGLDNEATLIRYYSTYLRLLNDALEGVRIEEGRVVFDLTEGHNLLIALSEEQVKARLFSDRLVLLLRHDGHAESGPLSLVMKDFDPDWFSKP